MNVILVSAFVDVIWYDNNMISMTEKDNAHKAWKRSHSLTDYQVFSELRTSFKKLKRESTVSTYHKSNNQLNNILYAYSFLPKASKRM